MKKLFILYSLLVSIIAVLAPMTAQAQQPGREYAIFNWQNNGDFNAFLNCDVDSITYSKVDLRGRMHTNVVVQEVWTPDSVYRIPLSSIDSVAFRAPEPVFKDDIFHIRDFHYPYVTEATDSTVTFDASIPTDSLPAIGQVVVSDIAYDEPFEYGFSGRVTRIVSLGEHVRIECEDVTIDDIFDELILVGKTAITCDENTTPSQVPKRINTDGVFPLHLGEIELEKDSINQGNIPCYFKLRIAPTIDIFYTIRTNVEGKKDIFKVVAHSNLDCHFDIGHKFFDNDIDMSFPCDVENVLLFKDIKIPTIFPFLHLLLDLGGYFNIKGTGSFFLSVPFTLNNKLGYDSQNGGLVFNFKGSEIKPLSFDVNINAEASFGLMMKFKKALVSEKISHFIFDLKAGPKYSGEISFSNSFGQSATWDDFKDTKISVSPLTATITSEVKIFGNKVNKEHTLFLLPEIDCYLFPEFSAPTLPSLNTNSHSLTALTTDISRCIMFPVTPGIGLFDNNNHLVDTVFSSKQYINPDRWDKKDLQMELLQKYPIGTYTAYPIFKSGIFRTVMALPTSEVTIPEPLSTEDSVLFMKVHDTQDIQMNGGWGSYTISNNETSVVSAKFISKDGTLWGASWQPTNGSDYDNEIPKIRIKGLKTGNATLTLRDRRSGDEVFINVFVNETGAEPSVTVSEDQLVFGNVLKGNQKTETFIVTGSNLVGNLTLSSNNSNFIVSPTSISKTDAANGVTVTVTYCPAAVGNHSGAISISGDGISKAISLSGTCVQPTITTNPTSLDFGNVTVGKSVSKSVTVTGTNTVGNISFVLQGTSTHANFTIIPQTLPASGGTVTVTCSATSAGNISGNLLISTTGADDVSVTLSGTAVNPPPSITVSPTSLAFGTVVKGNTAQKSFTVAGTNLTGNLTLSSNNSNFTVSPASITKADAANGVTVTVTYRPTAAGTHSGTITVSGSGISKAISLSGTCVQPTITTNPTSLDFGNVTVGKSVSKSVTVTGTNTVGNISFVLQGTSTHANFTISPQTLPASGGTVTVTCSATSAGNISGNLLISTTGADDVSVTLSGTAVNPPPSITVSPTSLSFGTVSKGSSKKLTFKVTGSNLTGNLTLSSSSSHFTVSPTTITKADAAGGVTVTVTYKPTAAGTHSGTITVSGSGISKTVSLSGICVQPTITTSPTSLSFGNVAVGKTKKLLLTVTGANINGNISLTLLNTGTNAEFILEKESLPASGGTVMVTCKANSAGNISGQILLSASGANDVRVSMSGTAITTSAAYDNIVDQLGPNIDDATSSYDIGSNMRPNEDENQVW